MRRLPVVLLLFVLAACATKPPPPPDCDGEYVPINAAVSTANAGGAHEARPSR